jgi:hypothetical protein
MRPGMRLVLVAALSLATAQARVDAPSRFDTPRPRRVNHESLNNSFLRPVLAEADAPGRGQ